MATGDPVTDPAIQADLENLRRAATGIGIAFDDLTARPHDAAKVKERLKQIGTALKRLEDKLKHEADK